MTTDCITIDPADVEVKINSIVERNTLPAFSQRLNSWLEKFNAADLQTDEDFLRAKQNIKNLKEAEDKLEEIHRQLFTGDAAAVMRSVAEMQEKVRQRRLELTRAVERQDKAVLESAIQNSRLSVEAELRRIPHARNIDIDAELRNALKGKRTIASKNAALEEAVNRIIDGELEYSESYKFWKNETEQAFKTAGEPVVLTEVAMLIDRYGANAADQARITIERRQLARERQRMEEERRKAEAEARAKAEAERKQAEELRQQQAETAKTAAKMPEQAVHQQPITQPATAIPQTPAAKPAATGQTSRQYRFGVTFTVADPAKVTAWLERAKGQNIKFVEIEAPKPAETPKPKEIKGLGWANGWTEIPEIVKNCTHKQKVEQTGRCEHRHTCEICGYTYMVDSSD